MTPPPHVRLHEFLRAIERFKDEPQKDDRVLERLLAERDERSAANAAADDSHARQPPKAPPPNPFATSGEERLSAADVAANAERSAGRADLALYVFDSDFSDYSGKSGLLRDVSGLPSLTTGDVFNAGAAADDRDRPVWRWLLAGPAGSGTCMHQDPWSYSSWNASLVGSKRWVLFPPDVSRETLHPPRTDLLGRAAAFVGIALPRRAAAFMDEILPALRGCGHGEVELVQQPGETVAFPADWHHCVVNLDATLAVTESYGRASDLDAIVE